jgi:hypothetical protein
MARGPSSWSWAVLSGTVWWWVAEDDTRVIVKFELLADRDDLPANVDLKFDGCDSLGAANLRGTGFASRDAIVQILRSKVAGDFRVVEVNVTGLAGFLLAKTAAARSRQKAKDWYDIAFVLQHNDAGGPRAAAQAVLSTFRADLVGATRTGLNELRGNFESPANQGPVAYASQIILDHPELSETTLRADAVLAVREFHDVLFAPAGA